MKLLTRRTLVVGGAVAGAALAAPRLVRAQTDDAAAEPMAHDVQMLNVDPDNPRLRQVFSPRLLVIQPGDTVNFIATDRGHNSEAKPDMIPEGVEAWEGAINEAISVTLETPGFYGYKCTPHEAIGMVGLIIVQGEGMMTNMEAARAVRHRGRARQVWEEIWAEVDSLELGAA